MINIVKGLVYRVLFFILGYLLFKFFITMDSSYACISYLMRLLHLVVDRVSLCAILLNDILIECPFNYTDISI